MTQPLYLGVYARILLDEGIGLWNVGLRLVIVIVRHKVFDGVIRHEFPELACQLCRQSFVVRQN
ncbi:unannotated protein [freshwater metagenome]|uniref:Unannotated protein n=1 Tax=freshwater metagenome TaxID=449393 RepID=A0A6J7GKZ4_9ZZZZ